MSTVAYGALSEARKQSDPADPASGPRAAGLGTYVDILAALVPAEVLSAHAVILTLATKTTKDSNDLDVTQITQKGALQATFWVLLVAAAGLFFVGRWLKAGGKKFDMKWDFVRLLIPPAAFVGWTWIQPTSAWDAISGWSGDGRAIAAVLAALVIAGVAGVLSVSAENAQPTA